MYPFRFEPVVLPPEAESLRAEVRAFLAEHLEGRSSGARARSWAGFDPEFSRLMGAAGYIGMTFPTEYGGHGRTAFERYVMLEEILAAGAPVSAHWVSDRQSGPLILAFGSEEMRRDILPRIVRGECYFCIGMSEPDSGSDLASIRTKGEHAGNGWRLNGTKVWTSNAHLSNYMIALVRTGAAGEGRHGGLSQFLIDLKATEGITIRPIRNLAGEEHFNEVIFEDAFVPADNLIGEEGRGWSQVMAELAFERAGPERYMSAYQLIAELVDEVAKTGRPADAACVGRLVAHLATLRSMSLSVAAKLQAGEDPALDGSVVKDLGTAFEQSIPLIAHQLTGAESSPDEAQDFASVLAYVTQVAPSFSLRGGTREILRGIIARGLGLR
jgi:alkylation response protein AidB-like acyl-CoA dehydrogenase